MLRLMLVSNLAYGHIFGAQSGWEGWIVSCCNTIEDNLLQNDGEHGCITLLSPLVMMLLCCCEVSACTSQKELGSPSDASPGGDFVWEILVRLGGESDKNLGFL